MPFAKNKKFDYPFGIFSFFRLNFCTPFSTNCVSICQSVGLHRVTRVECSTRFLLNFEGEGSLLAEEEEKLVLALHDRMTQCRYMEPLSTFEQSVHADNIFEVDVIEKGREALEQANKDLGRMFIMKLNLKYIPTNLCNYTFITCL